MIFSSIWLIFACKFKKIIWKLRRNKVRHLQNILKYHFDLKTTLRSPILDLNPDFSFVWTTSTLLLFLHSSLFHPKIPNPYCRKGFYGPYGPFRFLAKHRRGLVKRYQNENFGRKPIFSFHHENEFFAEVTFWKAPLLEVTRKLIFSFSGNTGNNQY